MTATNYPVGRVNCYFNPATGLYEHQAGTTNAPGVQLYAYQPSTLSVVPLTLDASGNLMVVGGGGGSGSNAAAGPTGSPVPSSADYTGWNSGGVLVGVALAAALPVQPGTGATFPVSGTFWQATQPVSIAAAVTTTPPANASTNITQLGGAAVTLGAKTSANSIPVVLASDQAALPVTGTFWQATQPVSIAATVAVSIAAAVAVTGTFWQATQPVSAASLPLPSGAATSALQSTINTTLGTPMQQTGGSLSVTNFPATQPISAASLPLPANAAQETGGNLASTAASLILLQSMIELQKQTLAVLTAIRLQAASAYNIDVLPSQVFDDSSVSIN